MTNIIVFTQNLRLDSLKDLAASVQKSDSNIFITTNYLFENERKFLETLFNNCRFADFADFTSDEENAEVDELAYREESSDYNKYLDIIKKSKNCRVIEEVIEQYPVSKRYIASFDNDLGLCDKAWISNGFRKVKSARFYYTEFEKSSIRRFLSRFTGLKRIYHKLCGGASKIESLDPEKVFVTVWKGKKYIFLGKMYRIGYRLEADFEQSKTECEKLNKGIYYPASECQYLTTWHEHSNCRIPDDPRYDVRWIQDGYLPPNYSHADYNFKPQNVKYYAWDVMGERLFKNKGLPVSLIPFRKKLYMPQPDFPSKVKEVLVIASGSGDWTALKNRSDDDMLVEATVKLAEKYPNIHFTFRCHPTWIHPLNVGVNAINRVHDYFIYKDLPNLTLSSNTPNATANGGFQLSFSRSSLDEDLKNADFVFGEHSVSMIDAAFKNIPFSSANLTGRRNFYISMTELGFPHCTTVDEMGTVIENIGNKDFQANYLRAVANYNKMTDEED
jgi:hypothetical protein